LIYKSVFLLCIGFFILTASCKNNKNNSGPAAVVADTFPKNGKSLPSETQQTPVINSSPLWNMEISDAGKNYMKKLRVPDSTELTAANLIALLNTKTENVQILLKKISTDSIFISIPNSEYLSQRMGSSGAEALMAETVFTLTELKGIRFVDFDFTEGDHAVPGTYQRKDFR
jgi:hypothetical protein